MASPATQLAEQILAQLGQDFTVPPVDLSDTEFSLPPRENNPRFDDVPPVSLESLTTGIVEGDGAFDTIMASTKAHLQEQYEAGRISGDQYAKAYIELTTASLSSAVQFLLEGNQSHWAAMIAQSQARKAEVDAVRAAVELETAKQQLVAATHQAKTQQAQHALVQMQLASEDANYKLTMANVDRTRFEVDEMLPVQKVAAELDRDMNQFRLDSLLPAQLLDLQAETSLKDYQLQELMPIQKSGAEMDLAMKTYQVDFVLPAQVELTGAQVVLTNEQMEAQRAQTQNMRSDGTPVEGMIEQQVSSEDARARLAEAQILLVGEQKEAQRGQTMDTRTDGTTIVGTLGRQKALYEQQVTSYKRDAETKAVKMYVDGWITQKTLDEGLQAPDELTNAGVDAMLASLRGNLSM